MWGSSTAVFRSMSQDEVSGTGQRQPFRVPCMPTWIVTSRAPKTILVRDAILCPPPNRSEAGWLPGASPTRPWSCATMTREDPSPPDCGGFCGGLGMRLLSSSMAAGRPGSRLARQPSLENARSQLKTRLLRLPPQTMPFWPAHRTCLVEPNPSMPAPEPGTWAWRNP